MTRSRRARKVLGTLVALALLCTIRPSAFQSASGLVTTAVTVRERTGRIVTNLTEQNFVVEEDGRKQTLARFTSERTPLSVAIAIDTSQNLRGTPMDETRAAVQRFIDAALRPDDEVALVSFNHVVNVAASWTKDRTRLRASLDALVPTGSTALYDAVFNTMSLFTTRSLQRAAMVVISSGADSASDRTPTFLKQQLVGTDLFLFWIAVDSVEARPSARINPQMMAEIAAQANGYSEVIHSTGELDAALTRVADELDHQYMLSYEPATPADRRVHTVRVKVSSGDYVVRARRGVLR